MKAPSRPGIRKPRCCNYCCHTLQIFLSRYIDGAIAIYDQIYQAHSDSMVIANNLASLLATWKADDPAALDRAEVVSRRLTGTQVPAFMDTFGWVEHLRGRSADALPYLQGAAAGLPEDAVVQIHLGLVQAALGLPEAAGQLDHALSMLPADDTRAPVQAARDARAKLAGTGAAPAAPAGTAPAAPAGTPSGTPASAAPAAAPAGAPSGTPAPAAPAAAPAGAAPAPTGAAPGN